jgi:hypothetical protein
LNERPNRVVVTHPRTRAVERRAWRAVEPGDGDAFAVSDLAIRAIVRAHLRLTLRYFAVLVGGLIALPSVVVLVGPVHRASLAGIPIAWVVFSVVFFPFFLVLGRSYVRAAERLEASFVDVTATR